MSLELSVARSGSVPSVGATTDLQFLLFRLGTDRFALDIARITEILRPLPITRVPRAPGSVLGIASVRGRLVTVVDFRHRLRVGGAPTDVKPRILILATEREDPMGLLVDEILGVEKLAVKDIEPAEALGITPSPYVAGVAHPQDEFVVVLSLSALLEEGL